MLRVERILKANDKEAYDFYINGMHIKSIHKIEEGLWNFVFWTSNKNSIPNVDSIKELRKELPFIVRPDIQNIQIDLFNTISSKINKGIEIALEDIKSINLDTLKMFAIDNHIDICRNNENIISKRVIYLEENLK